MISIQKSRAQAILFSLCSSVRLEPNVHTICEISTFSETTLFKVVLPTFENSNAKVEIVNRRSSRIFSSTALTKSSVITDGPPESGSS
ncbi:hypothetical protein TNCV_2715991 [Trichonephila clavipes]|nr:hypothetical protein TNCV_2715991 [Trichonephila clavipes]